MSMNIGGWGSNPLMNFLLFEQMNQGAMSPYGAAGGGPGFDAIDDFQRMQGNGGFGGAGASGAPGMQEVQLLVELMAFSMLMNQMNQMMGGGRGLGNMGGGGPWGQCQRVPSWGPMTPSTQGAQGAPDMRGLGRLNGEQRQNAQIIIDEGHRMGASNRDIQVALMTAMQESNLRNLRGGDRDSAGLFQQRPSCGWGSYSQVTDPHYAAQTFYRHLMSIPNRDSMALTQEAQSVQRSAFPYAYAKWEGLAAALVGSNGTGYGYA